MTRRLIDKRSLGFSLIELMVAISVASILMLLLVEFVQMVTSAVVTGEDSLFRTNDAQAAMDLLSGDLRCVKSIPPVSVLNASSTAVFPQVLQAYNDATGINVAPSGYANPQAVTINPMQLFLLSSASGSDGTGSGFPHLIRYRLSYEDPVQGSAGKNPILALYRDYVSGNDTFGLTSSGAGTPASIGTISGAENSAGLAGLGDLNTGYWQVNGYWSAYQKNPPTTDLLVSNVIDFQVLLYDVGKQSTTPNNPLNASVNVPTNIYVQTSAKTSGGQASLAGNGLQLGTSSSAAFTPFSSLVVEVKLSVLNERGVTLVNSGALKLTDPNLLNKYAQVYMRRIPLVLQ